MSTLAKLVGAPRADVIEGYVLSRPRLLEIAAAEEEFANRYMTMVAASVKGAAQTVAAVVLTSAKDDIKNGVFGYGGALFNVWALSSGNQPFLTYLSLRVKHGDKVSRADVEAMYEKGDPDAISEATLTLWGFLEPVAKKDDGLSNHAPSTGPQSSPDSAETTKVAAG